MDPPSRPPGISPMRQQGMTRPSPHTGMPDMNMGQGLRHNQSFSSLIRQYPYQGLHDEQRWQSDPFTPQTRLYHSPEHRVWTTRIQSYVLREGKHWDLNQFDPYQGVTGNNHLKVRSWNPYKVEIPALVGLALFLHLWHRKLTGGHTKKGW